MAVMQVGCASYGEDESSQYCVVSDTMCSRTYLGLIHLLYGIRRKYLLVSHVLLTDVDQAWGGLKDILEAKQIDIKGSLLDCCTKGTTTVEEVQQ